MTDELAAELATVVDLWERVELAAGHVLNQVCNSFAPKVASDDTPLLPELPSAMPGKRPRESA